jgi:hypothetical protein
VEAMSGSIARTRTREALDGRPCPYDDCGFVSRARSYGARYRAVREHVRQVHWRRPGEESRHDRLTHAIGANPLRSARNVPGSGWSSSSAPKASLPILPCDQARMEGGRAIR